MHTRVLHLLFICLFGLCLALPRAASCMDEKKTTAHLGSLELKDGRLVLRQTGKPLPDGVATLTPVEHSDMRFAVVEAFAVERDKLPVRPGLYLVRSDGAVTYFNSALEDEGPEAWESVVAVSLSPDKDILALGYFATLQGGWYFFHWPDVRPLEHPTTVGYWETSRESPPLLWSGKRQVVVDSMDVEGCKRPCDYDPCGRISVVAYDLDTGKTSPIFQGTDLCDYRVRSVKNGSVTATKLCLPKVAAWKNYPGNASAETVAAPLP